MDFIGIGRAVWVNLRAGTTREGASTITQQVARNLFLTRERTLRRKIREAILARRIEQRYDKDRILQIYLNQIFYGHNTYGIEAAAQLYCGKSVADLSLADGAMIAGLPPAPNTYSPLRNPQRSLRRRAHVLRRMVDEGYLAPEKAAAAEQQPMCSPGERPHVTHRVNKAPYFVEHVRQHLEDAYGPDGTVPRRLHGAHDAGPAAATSGAAGHSGRPFDGGQARPPQVPGSGPPAAWCSLRTQPATPR